MRNMRKLIPVVVALAMAPVVSSGAAATGPASARFPDVIGLPDGTFPEGIAVGRGSTFYVGSLNDGSVLRGDLRTGEASPLTAPTGPFSAVGLDVDNRNRVWVAGGPSGTARVYDGASGALVAAFQFTAPFQSFINDVIVTGDAAWFTDSGTQNAPDPGQFRFAGEPRLFRVPLERAGAISDSFEVVEVDVPDVAFPNLNGIETAPGNAGLVVAHTTLGALFTVDPASGDAELTYDGGLQGADGLSRRGTVIHVVENGASRIASIAIDPSTGTGTLQSTTPVVGAETPTTGALFGSALYAVDARFGTPAGPDVAYNVFRVDL